MSATLVKALRGFLPLLIIVFAAVPAYAAGPADAAPRAVAGAEEVAGMPVEEWSEEPDPAAEALYADSLDSLTGLYPVRCKRVRAARVHTNGAFNDLWKYWQQQASATTGRR